jgi:hypothetical protein
MKKPKAKQLQPAQIVQLAKWHDQFVIAPE